jgi:hypothetical protein
MPAFKKEKILLPDVILPSQTYKITVKILSFYLFCNTLIYLNSYGFDRRVYAVTYLFGTFFLNSN